MDNIKDIQTQMAAKYGDEAARVFGLHYHWYVNSGPFERDQKMILATVCASLAITVVFPFTLLAALRLTGEPLLSTLVAGGACIPASVVGWFMGRHRIHTEALGHAWKMTQFAVYADTYGVPAGPNGEDDFITGYVMGRTTGDDHGF